jgi:hypothetical protein
VEYGSKGLKSLVDLVGFEPTTSSMPWKPKTGRPLILKALMTGGVGHNRRKRRTLLPNYASGLWGWAVGDQPLSVAARAILNWRTTQS